MKTWRGVFTSAVFRLVMIVLAVVIPLNLLTLILSSTVITEVENQLTQETKNAMQIFMKQFDDAMHRIDVKLYMLAHSNVDFQRLTQEARGSTDDYYERVQSLVRLRITLDDTLADHSLIDGVYAYFPETDYVAWQGRTQAQSNAVVHYIREHVTNTEEQECRSWHIASLSEGAFLVLVSSRRNAYYGAWISLPAMADRLGTFYGEDYVFNAFTDSEGKVYLASSDDMPELKYGESGLFANGEQHIVIKVDSEKSILRYVQVLSRNQFVEALPAAIRVLKMLSVASVFIVPVIAIAIRCWVVRPLGMLVHAMERIEQGDVGYRIPKKRRVGSEFDRINGYFNHMMDEVSDLKIQMYEQKLKAEKTRLDFLSQQIQPHFILNTLNILYSYEPEEYKLSRTMILCLSKYFRYVVNANADYVELGQEMEHIRNYFGIQQARFLSGFQATIECDEALSNCLIPPLIVQNFTENTIKHALIPGEKVDILVRVWQTVDNNIHILILDNGPGIPDEVLKKIQAFRDTREFRHDLGTGIQNAIDRLELIYGDKAHLQIGRAGEAGTRVDIELPVQRRGESSDECDPY